MQYDKLKMKTHRRSMRLIVEDFWRRPGRIPNDHNVIDYPGQLCNVFTHIFPLILTKKKI